MRHQLIEERLRKVVAQPLHGFGGQIARALRQVLQGQG